MTGTHSVTDSGLKVKKRRHLSTCIKLLKSESLDLHTQSANTYALRRIAFFLHFLAHCELRHTTTHKQDIYLDIDQIALKNFGYVHTAH